jgi:exonuclease SbcD
MKFLMNNLKSQIKNGERNVLITHGYAIYYSEGEDESCLETCDSERPLSMGGTELIDVKNFDFFNYVALGHLHGPQKVGSDKVRYSGSLLKYSISEWKQKKSISIIDLNGDGDVEVQLKKLPVLRDLRVIRGPLEELLKRENHYGTNLEDYVFVELTDEGEILDAISKIRAVFPNVMGLKMVNLVNGNLDSKTSASSDFREKSMEELFNEFYINLKGKPMDEERLKEVLTLLGEVERGEI